MEPTIITIGDLQFSFTRHPFANHFHFYVKITNKLKDNGMIIYGNSLHGDAENYKLLNKKGELPKYEKVIDILKDFGLYTSDTIYLSN